MHRSRSGLPVFLTAAMTLGAVVGLLDPTRTVAHGHSAAQAAPRTAVLSVRRVPSLLSQAIADTRLVRSLDAALADPDLGGGRSQSCLVVGRPGERVYERRVELALAPASTLKLLTAVAALHRLGAQTTFTTRVAAGAAARGGTVDGDVWLIGGGDPLLGTPDYEASFKDQPRLFTNLDELASRVAAAGVRTITGRVLGDESRYDTQRYVPTWKTAYGTDGDVGPLSALNVNDGFAAWKPKAVPAPVPPGRAAAVFADLLKAHGVTVAGQPDQGTAPSAAKTIASIESMTVKQIVGEMLIHSDNETAELLTKELGLQTSHSGTTAAGVTATRSALSQAGLSLAGVNTVDGSGLDASDRVPCALLYALISGPTGAEVAGAGLPVAAGSGTLFDKFIGSRSAGRLRAKTGTLEGVVGLVGLMDPLTPGPPPLTFAFLASGLAPPSEPRGVRADLRLGAALATYPDAPPPAALAP